MFDRAFTAMFTFNVVAGLTMFITWLINIFQLLSMSLEPVTLLLILRIIGVLAAPVTLVTVWF